MMFRRKKIAKEPRMKREQKSRWEKSKVHFPLLLTQAEIIQLVENVLVERKITYIKDYDVWIDGIAKLEKKYKDSSPNIFTSSHDYLSVIQVRARSKESKPHNDDRIHEFFFERYRYVDQYELLLMPERTYPNGFRKTDKELERELRERLRNGDFDTMHVNDIDISIEPSNGPYWATHGSTGWYKISLTLNKDQTDKPFIAHNFHLDPLEIKRCHDWILNGQDRKVDYDQTYQFFTCSCGLSEDVGFWDGQYVDLDEDYVIWNIHENVERPLQIIFQRSQFLQIINQIRNAIIEYEKKFLIEFFGL